MKPTSIIDLFVGVLAFSLAINYEAGMFISLCVLMIAATEILWTIHRVSLPQGKSNVDGNNGKFLE